MPPAVWSTVPTAHCPGTCQRASATPHEGALQPTPENYRPRPHYNSKDPSDGNAKPPSRGRVGTAGWAGPRGSTFTVAETRTPGASVKNAAGAAPAVWPAVAPNASLSIVGGMTAEQSNKHAPAPRPLHRRCAQPAEETRGARTRLQKTRPQAGPEPGLSGRSWALCGSPQAAAPQPRAGAQGLGRGKRPEVPVGYNSLSCPSLFCAFPGCSASQRRPNTHRFKSPCQ